MVDYHTWDITWSVRFLMNELRGKGQNKSHGSMILLGRGHMGVGERESLSVIYFELFCLGDVAGRLAD